MTRSISRQNFTLPVYIEQVLYSLKGSMMGYHALIDVHCCDKTDNESVNTLCTRMVELSKCTELKRVSHEFEPQGFTVLLLLAESHISCHTWPERRSMCIDMFTCCPREPDWNQLTSEIQRELGGQVSLHVVYRGQPMANAWPRRRWRDSQQKKSVGSSNT